MAKVLSLAVLTASAVTLGACGVARTPPQHGGPARLDPPIVTNVQPYKAGNGVVQSVSSAPVMAGAGSSAEPRLRLEIRMDDGSIQYVDTPSREFTRGMRVTLTEDRLIRRM